VCFIIAALGSFNSSYEVESSDNDDDGHNLNEHSLEELSLNLLSEASINFFGGNLSGHEMYLR
jgi:hypothetical protein